MWIAIVVALVVSFFIANVIAWGLEALRSRRMAKHAEQLSKPSRTRTPITVVTGFLGAGKTTLINNILTADKLPYRIAIIENEVGAVSVDDKLLAPNLSDPSRGIYVLQNGCLCCMATGPGSELDRTVSRLSSLCEMESYDYVIVELSGLADPGPILRFFSSYDMSQGRFYLDGVVAVVDSTTAHRFVAPAAREHIEHPVEARRQVAYADIALLNKTDLAPAQQLLEARAAVRGANPTARIIETQRARVELRRILGINAYASLDTPAVSRIAEAVEAKAHADDQHDHDHHGHDHHDHDDDEEDEGTRAHARSHAASGRRAHRAVPSHLHDDDHSGHDHDDSGACVHHRATSVSMRVSGPVDGLKLRATLAQLVDELGERLYRVKGVVTVEGSDKHLVLQGVCAHLEAYSGRQLQPGADRSGVVVFIGQSLDEGVLRQALQQCTASDVHVVTNAVEVHEEGDAGTGTQSRADKASGSPSSPALSPTASAGAGDGASSRPRRRTTARKET